MSAVATIGGWANKAAIRRIVYYNLKSLLKTRDINQGG
jgi:hypothetical protein